MLNPGVHRIHLARIGVAAPLRVGGERDAPDEKSVLKVSFCQVFIRLNQDSCENPILALGRMIAELRVHIYSL